MGRILFVICIVAAFVFLLNPAEAAKPKTPDVGTVPIPVDSKAFDPSLEMPFEIGHFVNDEGVNIYVVNEEFGMLNIETDVIMDVPLQNLPKDQERDMLLDFGYEIAQYIIPKLYGTQMHELHVGNVYIGKPSMNPEGSITMVDVKFLRDGLMWKGRVGIMSKNMESNNPKDQFWFVYPVSR